MRIDLVTLFPEMFSVVRDLGVTGRAHGNQLWSLHTHSPRDYTEDVHRTVDDRPYGGGPGMVMMAEPLTRALSAIRAQRDTQDHAGQERAKQEQAKQEQATQDQAPVVLLSPIGKPFDQAQAQRLAQSSGAIFICGRYEGVDDRVRTDLCDGELSIGDYVLGGGEVAAMVVLEAVGRLVPGVMGNSASAGDESFSEGLLEYPQFTKPAEFRGMAVPEVLRSGDHGRIARWRRAQALRRTRSSRPDLIEARGGLSEADEALLADPDFID